MKKKINIGFDIGVASVGWSILDEENNLINYGSRLFSDAAGDAGKLENQKRRAQRSLRRRIRRVKNRKIDFLKLLIKYNLIKEIEYEEFCELISEGILDDDGIPIPTIEIKYKGLFKKLPKKELLVSLFHYIHNRGYFYITEEEINKDETKLNNKEINKFPTEVQVEFLRKNGYYKGAKENNYFSNRMWLKEIEKFLSNQKLDENFNKEYINLFTRIRDFSEGPGSKKSPTKYGLYRIVDGKFTGCV